MHTYGIIRHSDLNSFKNRFANTNANIYSAEKGLSERINAVDKHIRDYAEKNMAKWVNNNDYFGKYNNYFFDDKDQAKTIGADVISKIVNEIKRNISNNDNSIHPDTNALKATYDSIIDKVLDKVLSKAKLLEKANRAAGREYYHGGHYSGSYGGDRVAGVHSREENARDAEIMRRKGQKYRTLSRT